MNLPVLSPSAIRERTWPALVDLLVFGIVLAAIFGVLAVGRYWLGAVTPAAQISRSPSALPAYAFYSLVRMTAAYVLSLGFALAYGYIAASTPRVEAVMIAALDILQSIPVLSFLPGVMLAMVALFPSRQLGLELGSIVLIFTGQVWNMAFSFYSSLKSIPRELLEAAEIYRFSRWQRFLELELPYGAIGLVWNSIVSVAAGWFFLMACEMFVLRNRDFRLPGLGSYLQTAAANDDTRAILWGLAAMIAVIVLLDQIVWRPLISWSDRFKFEQVESAAKVTSPLLRVLLGSRLFRWADANAIQPAWNRLTERAADPKRPARAASKNAGWLLPVAGVAISLAAVYALFQAALALKGVTRAELFFTIGAAARYLCAGRHCFSDRLTLDDPRRRSDRLQPETGTHCAAAGADRGFHSGDGAISRGSTIADQNGRRIGRGRGRADAAGDAVVYPVQRDCRRHGDSHGIARSRVGFSLHAPAALDHRDPARNFSVSDNGPGDCLGRRLEREHRRRVRSFSEADPFHSGFGRGNHRRQRVRQFQRVAALHRRDGRAGGVHQPPGVAAAIPDRRDTVPAGSVARAILDAVTLPAPPD